MLTFTFAAAPANARPQQSETPDLRAEVGQLKSQLSTTQDQLKSAQGEIEQLRKELQAIQVQLGVTAKPSGEGNPYPTLQNALKESQPETAPNAQAASNEEQQVLAARVDEQAQTKVESASRYKVKLSGLILMNTYANVGRVDITDLPNLAFPKIPGTTGGDFGATLRQTQVGLEVMGPKLGEASSGGEVRADFFGGFPDFNYGVTAGLFRLRTAEGYLAWQHTRIVAGQGELFFSPLSPTSYATLAEPALAWSGNLWVWTPQIRVEHDWNVSENSKFTAQFGVLDALAEGDPPDQFNRRPTAGEASRIPAFAWHGAWSTKWNGGDARIGVGSYYSRQSYTFNRKVDSWAVMADYTLPLSSKIGLSGEVTRGRALGGLGGGIWNSVVYSGNPALASSSVLGLNDIGGWSQLKLQPVSKLELNVAAGIDNPFSSDIHFFPNPTGTYFPPLVRNQTLFANWIYTPRSNLLLALEYRHLRTYFLNGTNQNADHVNLAVGVSF